MMVDMFVQTVFFTRKSLGGHAKTYETSPLLKIIKFQSGKLFKKPLNKIIK